MSPDQEAPQDPQDSTATAAPPSWRFDPIGTKLAVRPIPEGERTVGSIVIPDTAKERPSMAEVVAVGRGVGPELLQGDRVLYGKYSGHEVTIDEITYVVLDVSEVLSRMIPPDEIDDREED